ncbi:MAG TPA: hypothetical protein VMG34_13420 [Bacteroidota bacterium]|nr:hypothetical protein [Bacteroidota bacterium]
MVVSQDTATLVASLQEYSGSKLRHAGDLAILIELSRSGNQQQVLEDLSFLSKFLVNTRAVMDRVGKGGEGYDKLSFQFTENLEKASTFVRLLVKESPDETKRHFTSTYFSMTPAALSSLMELFYDISWLKNWNIDHSPLRDG